MTTKSSNLKVLIPIFCGVIFFAGCHKRVASAPSAPSPAPPAPPAPTVTLQASPADITTGGSARLAWSSSNAAELKLEPGLGTVTPKGSTKVSPTESTTYTITATGPGGSASASASITVVQPPLPPPPPQPSIGELFAREVQDAYFDYNKADIRADARGALTKTADFLRRYPEVKVTVEGHCDDRGSEEYNLGLGDRRATSVKKYMVSLGIAEERIRTMSYGKEHPFCTEHNEACWQQNRRGHFIMAR
jgi:peptidoglycan-associated lipoprotein